MNKNETQNEMPIISQEELESLKQSIPQIPWSNNKFGPNKLPRLLDPESFLARILLIQRHFLARDSDLIITGLPKTGITWLKSLLFTIVNRASYPINQNPLLKNHPQELVYNLESDIYGEAFAYPRPQHLVELPSPRLLSTHLPYTSLPESIRTSSCRLLYICWNPLDTLTSLFHFAVSYMKNTNSKEVLSFEDLFDDFCAGKSIFGPFFEHVVTYWKMSLDKYEDLKDDPKHHLKRVAEFIGMPFTPFEESQSVIDQILEFCSIGNMMELEVNKSGVINKFFEKKSYFRKGEVGQWRNYFTPLMVEKMTNLMEEKLQGTGLSFKLIP